MRKIFATILSVLMLGVCVIGITACGDTPEPKDERPVMVVLGDSWSAGVGASWAHVGEDDTQKHAGAYGTICGEISGYKTYNYAVGGYKVESVSTQVKSDTNVIAHIKEANVVYLGVIGNNVVMNDNRDQILADAAQGKFTLLDQMIGTLRLNWAEMIETIKGYNAEAEIIVHNVVSMGLEKDDVTEAEVEGGDKAYVRLHNQVVKYYLNAHPNAYKIATLTSRNPATDESSGDGHPNDVYHVRLAISLYNKMKSWNIPVSEDVAVLDNLKNYTAFMFEGFNKYMAQLKTEYPSHMTTDIAVDVDAYKTQIAELSTTQEVYAAFAATYAQKDPRPYGTPEWSK